MRILVLQHVACEPPGEYEKVMNERGVELVRIELDEGEPLPDWRDFDGIVAMGGPMDTLEEDRYAWLAPEKQLVASAVGAGLPFWGVCLGAQLLADALGASVYPGPEPEIGLSAIALAPAAAADPVLSGLPNHLPAFHWHSCTFDLPADAVPLAASPAYENQIFRAGRLAYGVQCHLEVSVGLVRDWLSVPAYSASLEQARGEGAGEVLLAELESAEPQLRSTARKLFARWLDLALDQ